MRREDINALPKLVQQYLVYIEAIKEHSELSVLEYAGDLRTFSDIWLKKKVYPLQMFRTKTRTLAKSTLIL